MEAVNEAAQFHRGNILKEEAATLDKIKEYGVQVDELSVEVKEQLREKIEQAIGGKLAEIAGQDNYELVQKCVEETRNQ